ncbi:WapI family immunity protein [Peribacillus kribbensis]|uniref:WapI family immunity protein n=1 Tax=Peribacillus kribbensis TaxID=356658 RepID=UPI00042016FE|nr:hypothetical protein [Peribacillus kribbensis]
MNQFMIAGKQGFIRIKFNKVHGFPEETSYLGGYDVEGNVEIKSGNYYVKDAEFWFSTGQVYQFFIQLQKCYSHLKGCVSFSDENTLKIDMHFNKFGGITIQGYFQETAHQENILHFEFESDQSYLVSTLQQLQNIADQYGDLKGKR